MTLHPVANPEWDRLLARDAITDDHQHRQDLMDRHGPARWAAEAASATGPQGSGAWEASAGVASAAQPARPTPGAPLPPGQGAGTDSQSEPHPRPLPATGPGARLTALQEIAAYLRAHVDVLPEQRQQLAALRLARDLDDWAGGRVTPSGFHMKKKAPRAHDAGATTRTTEEP